MKRRKHYVLVEVTMEQASTEKNAVNTIDRWLRATAEQGQFIVTKITCKSYARHKRAMDRKASA